jgi:hypothetical protein
MKICPLLTVEKGYVKCPNQELIEKYPLYNKFGIEDWIRVYCVSEYKKCEYFKK